MFRPDGIWSSPVLVIPGCRHIYSRKSDPNGWLGKNLSKMQMPAFFQESNESGGVSGGTLALYFPGVFRRLSSGGASMAHYALRVDIWAQYVGEDFAVGQQEPLTANTVV
jgi:hypothetical protein